MISGKLVVVTILPASGEPTAGPWRVASVRELVRLLVDAADPPAGRPWLVGVDGRSGGGKSTLAAKLHAAVPASVVIHTDDIAWHHSRFDWSELLARSVLQPIRNGQPVDYRPPGWESHGRPGVIEVPTGLDLVIIEGVGAGRRELAHLLDAVVWVQSDYAEAERRGIARDVASGVNGDRVAAASFWHSWMAEELPFLEHQRPWERAAVIVAGTPLLAHGDRQVVLAPPLGAAQKP
jgi:uridine kinase